MRLLLGAALRLSEPRLAALEAYGLVDAGDRLEDIAAADLSTTGLAVKGEQRSLLYVKTHKTGSSTLGAIFYRLAAARKLSVMTSPNCCDFNYPGKFPGEGDYQYGQYDAILGHAVFEKASMERYLKHRPFVVTILRDPVERLHSAIKYYQTPFSTHAHRIYMHDPGLQGDDVYDWDKWLSVDLGKKGGHNSMSADLGWVNNGGTWAQVRRGMTEEDCRGDAAQAWLDRIEQELDVVVVTEQYEESLVLLSRRLEQPIEAMAFLRVDQHQGGCGPADCDRFLPPEGEQRQKVMALNCLDVQLYERLGEKTRREYEQLISTDPSAVEDLAKLKELNAGLLQSCDERSCPDWHKDGTIAFCRSLEQGGLRGDPHGSQPDGLCSLGLLQQGCGH